LFVVASLSRKTALTVPRDARKDRVMLRLIGWVVLIAIVLVLLVFFGLLDAIL
jgi:hypothetical protein